MKRRASTLTYDHLTGHAVELYARRNSPARWFTRGSVGLGVLRSGWFEEAQALACVAVVTNYTLLDAALITRLHAAGMRALCYTVNDPATAQWLLGIGIDGIITDAVDRFSPTQHPRSG